MLKIYLIQRSKLPNQVSQTMETRALIIYMSLDSMSLTILITSPDYLYMALYIASNTWELAIARVR